VESRRVPRWLASEESDAQPAKEQIIKGGLYLELFNPAVAIAGALERGMPGAEFPFTLRLNALLLKRETRPHAMVLLRGHTSS
jgi:hypothetical protein